SAPAAFGVSCAPAKSSSVEWTAPALSRFQGREGKKWKGGGLAGTRTLDQCLKRALLYQLSYQPGSVPQQRRSNIRAQSRKANHFFSASLFVLPPLPSPARPTRQSR